MTTRSLLSGVLATLLLSIAACGGTAEGQPADNDAQSFPAESAGWPETITTTSAWPYFGSGNTGVVIAPRWVAPKELGCGQQVRVRTEPSRDFAPGDGPRTVYGPTLGVECAGAGVSLIIVDEAGYDEANLFRGNCATGIKLSTQSGNLAEVHYATKAACETFVEARAAAAKVDVRQRSKTELKLSALQPATVFDFVSITEGEESERFAITQKK